MSCVPPPRRATTPDPVAAFDASDAARARRSQLWRLGLCAAGLLAVALLGWVTRLPSFSMCTFQIVFGRPCPGCGMTRSVRALAHGDLIESLRMHPLGVVLVGGTAWGFVDALRALRTGRDRAWDWVETHSTLLASLLFGAFLLLWIVRGFVVPDWSPDPIR